MISFGRLLNVPYLLCSNHTIHLAVTDKLFQKRLSYDKSNDGNSEIDSDEEQLDSDRECEELSQVFEPLPDYQETIKKMREIIKIFQYSPLRAGILETVQRNEGKKPLKLINDVVTRWNSLVISGKRFLDLRSSIVQALKHRDIRSSILWNDEDTRALQVTFETNTEIGCIFTLSLNFSGNCRLAGASASRHRRAL